MCPTPFSRSNQDLLDYCGQLLASAPRTALTVEPGDSTLEITTHGLTLVDLYADRHPVGRSLPVTDANPVSLPIPAFRETLEIQGFRGATLKQRRVIRA
jgi:hypothetical protein